MAESALQANAVASLPGAAAAAVAWRLKGQLHVTVVAKATFAFAPDADMRRVDPQPIVRTEIHHGNDPGRSVRVTSDLAPHLGQVDVLFTGHAYAPSQHPVRSMLVRLGVFDGQRPALDKRLVVEDAGGFLRMPVVYERALRGADGQDNPLGVAMSAGEPNIKDPITPGRAAGFGPIARAWPARKRLLGSTPRKVLEGPIAEIPEAFDWSYFQAAPPDQRIDRLSGEEWILLEGLSPALPRLATRLPSVRGRAQVHGLAALGIPEGQPLDLFADTLRIDGDEGTCTVVCRRSLAVPGEAALAALWIAAGIESVGEPARWPEQRAPASAAAAPEPAKRDEASSTLRSMTIEDEVTLHYGGPSAPAGGEELGEAVALDDDAIEVVEEQELGTVMLSPGAGEPLSSRPVLPFGPASPRASFAPEQRPAPESTGGAQDEHAPTGTFVLAPEEEEAASHRPAWPFVADPAEELAQESARKSAAPAAPSIPAAPSTPAAPAEPSMTLVLSPERDVDAAVLPFPAPSRPSQLPVEPRPSPSRPIPGAPWSERRAQPAPAPLTDTPTLMLAGNVLDAITATASKPLPGAGSSPSPFAAFSPPSTPAAHAPSSALDAPSPPSAPAPPSSPSAPASLSPPSAPASLSSPMPAPPSPPSAPTSPRAPSSPSAPSPPSAPALLPEGGEVTLERCATISAELAMRSAPRAAVLSAHGLTEARFRSAEKRWNDAIAEALGRGDPSLRDMFDAGYVAAWEVSHGPLEVATYVQLTLADERGDLASALDALAIPRTVWMRMKRLWTRRVRENEALSTLVKKELAKYKR